MAQHSKRATGLAASASYSSLHPFVCDDGAPGQARRDWRPLARGHAPPAASAQASR